MGIGHAELIRMGFSKLLIQSFWQPDLVSKKRKNTQKFDLEVWCFTREGWFMYAVEANARFHLSLF